MTPEELRELDTAVAKHEGLQDPPSTPQEIARAAFSCFSSSHPMRGQGYTEYTWDIPGYGGMLLQNRESKWAYKGTTGNDGYGLWLWEQRHGSPWQDALEHYVAAWRPYPKLYSTDWRAAGPLLEKYQLDLYHEWSESDVPPRWQACNLATTGVRCDALFETPLIAICQAVLAQEGRE